MDDDAPAMDADLGAGVDEADARIGRGVHELLEHRREPRRRRRPQAVLPQEPAQQIARAVRRADVERDQRGPVERRAGGGVRDDRAIAHRAPRARRSSRAASAWCAALRASVAG